MRTTTVLFVYIALVVVWTGLAKTMQTRHDAVDRKLRHDVASLWGNVHHQASPKLSDSIGLESADVKAHLDLDYRKKGQYWYSTYKVDFRGEYQLQPGFKKGTTFSFPLPSSQGMYNGFSIEIDGKKLEDFKRNQDRIEFLIPNEKVRSISISYQGQGSDQWWYSFDSSAKNLRLNLTTNFAEIDFPDGSLSPASRKKTESGWQMAWNYQDLISGGKIALKLPKKQNPGPALIDICQFAPLGLLLFFLALGLSAAAQKLSPHPVHFVFLGISYFSFHSLLVYLGDVIPITPAFAISALASTFIAYSYSKRVFGTEFANFRLLPVSTLYLAVFSSIFLFESKRGLLLVSLGMLTLHILMQVASNIDWDGLEAKRSSEGVRGEPQYS